MVNYKRVVCVAALLAAASAAPVSDCADRHFDQRQNGTENYRLNIDGVVIAVAPADSLLAAASEIDLNDLLALDDFEPQKPKPPANEKPESPLLEPKPQEVKPEGSKPESSKPAENPLSDVSLNSVTKSLNKEPSSRNREKANRLKSRLASILLPLLRRARHH